MLSNLTLSKRVLTAMIIASSAVIIYELVLKTSFMKKEPKPTTVGITPVVEGQDIPKDPIVSLSLPNGPRPFPRTEEAIMLQSENQPFPTTDFMVSSRSVPTIRQFAEEFIRMIERFRIHDPDNGFLEPEFMANDKREDRINCAIEALQGITNNSKMNLIYDCVKTAKTLEEYKECYAYIYE